MKEFVLALGLLAVQAQANWVETWAEQRHGEGPIGVSSILKEHAQPYMCSSLQDVLQETVTNVAAGVPIDPVIAISVKRTGYEWRGATTCAENDQRLFQIVCEGSVTYNTHSFSFIESLTDSDPCALKQSPFKKTKKSIKQKANI